MPDLVKLPPFGDDGDVRVVIETPRGSRAKFNYDPDLQTFTLAKSLFTGLTYPHDWGFVPSTKAEDGDPLDIMVIHDAATFPGLVLTCRLIGILQIEQKHKSKKERNDRLFAVPRRSHSERALHDVPTASRTTALFQIIRTGRSSSTKARFVCRRRWIPLQSLKSCLAAMVGARRGGTASPTMFIVIPAPTKCLASRAAAARFSRTVTLKAGDVAILAAGTGHQCLASSQDFLVVGAYPRNGTYDECTSLEDRKKALASIPKTARTRNDPVYGASGPLLGRWRTARQKSRKFAKNR